MRDIGINVSRDVIYGVDPFMTCVKHTGFDAVFTYGNIPDYISHVAEKCAALGLRYEALHAPWDNINDLERGRTRRSGGAYAHRERRSRRRARDPEDHRAREFKGELPARDRRGADQF